MRGTKQCEVCSFTHDKEVCPECKGRAEKAHASEMNDAAMERIRVEETVPAAKKEEPKKTPEELKKIEKVFFEDDEKIKLRDGKTYSIAPSSLKEARVIMDMLKLVNIDYVALNFVPTGDDSVDDIRQEALFRLLDIAFEPHGLNREYIDSYVDVKTAKDVVDILIGLNGLKK